MKRLNNLFDKVISLDNLRLADEKARLGKLKSYGVIKHDKNREENIQKLHEDLKNNRFKTSPYDTFKIYAPKEREIFRLPYYPDRIVHHAVMNILEPIWMKVFNNDTYSCIKGRGIHLAVKRLKKVLRNDTEGTMYCLKLDVRKFYPSIDHYILKEVVRRKIKDERLLNLLDEIIDSADGVPIGNYLSQYFANLYLAYFDHWVKENLRVKYYFRYADDIVILANSKKDLREYFVQIKRYLDKELKLEIKDNYQIFPVEARGIDFIGYVFYHTHTRLRKNIKQNYFRKVAKLIRKNISDKKIAMATASWHGWAKYCDSINLKNKINESILQRRAA